MTDSITLHELIRAFELPPADGRFPEFVFSLGEQARRRASEESLIPDDVNAGYFYLLARVYELLGYSARHTPWLSYSPRFYWQKARAFVEEARELTPTESSYRPFLNGKSLLREAMIHTLDGESEGDKSKELLATAEKEFEEAARREPDAALRYIYKDAAAIARTEGGHRTFRQQLRSLTKRATKAPSAAVLDRLPAQIEEFPEQQWWTFPSRDAGMEWQVQHALAKARRLYAKAQMFEEVATCIEAMQKALNDRSFGAELLEECETGFRAAHEESSTLCDDVGLTIRAADSRVSVLRRKAEASLQHCIRQFKALHTRENEERSRLLEDAGPPPRLLPPKALHALKSVLPDQDPVKVPDDFVAAAREVEFLLDDQATVFAESPATWLLRDGRDRYLVRAGHPFPEVVDLHRQPIPFSHREAVIFRKYATLVENTCQLYVEATREIHRALEEASRWYEVITERLEPDTKAVPHDADLASLLVTTSSILKELNSRNYPLLGVLRDRMRYAWSLLEMFQMRNQSVRLGTLFSGQCQLIMANPFYDDEKDLPEDEFLEVGADPIFKTTLDFIFRGAKGEPNRHDFQKRALKTTGTTIDQQEISLWVESRYLDLDPMTRRALQARLACHRSVALALERFTPIFVAQRAGEIPTDEIKKRLAEIKNHFVDAETALDACGEYPSKLIDRFGLDALQDYMKGIAQVLIGMNEREQKRQWAGIYRDALAILRDAKKKLGEVGDVYLLPWGDSRKEYLLYVEARILTVAAFKSWYHADEGKYASAAEYVKAAESFESSAAIFEKLHDYRVATKARARAAHARSGAETGYTRYQRLKEANAFYAACGDTAGYGATAKLLKDEFADEEAGLLSAKGGERHPKPPSAAGAARIATAAREKFGPYEVELIDSGGMADVYVARLDGKPPVALKRINDAHVDDVEFINRFLTEFETGKSLSHPSIVEVYDRGEVEGIPYFTMELLKGKPLEKIVTAHEMFAPNEAVRIVKQIAEALDFAHGKGVIHRDLKPANVMLLENNRVKVMDFGIAHNPRFPRMTKAGDFIGTPPYAAPEQLNGGRATPQSDLYSLGLIFYEVLTGKAALHFRRRRREDHPAPSAAVANLPVALDGIVLKLLARNPDFRYQSAEDLIGALASYLGRH